MITKHLSHVVGLLVLVALSLHVVAKYEEQLVFYDDFFRLDNSKWKHAITLTGGGNWEFQQYVNNRSTSWTDNGILYLKPMLTEDFLGSSISNNGASIDLWGVEVPDQCTSNFQYGCQRTAMPGFVLNPITSARIRTAESFSFKYGRVEIKAKLPAGDWIWPAMWLMPRYNVYGPWPASGEIDIMESRGNRNYRPVNPEGGVESSSSTLHWGPFYGANGYPLTRKVKHLENGKTFNDDFHVFGLYWDTERMYSYIDDPSNKVLDVDLTIPFWKRAVDAGMPWDKQKLFNPWVNAPARAPFNQEFFLILNNAVGGTNGYFPDLNAPVGNPNVPKPWRNDNPNAFKQFWDNRATWLKTWKNNDTALQIDWVKIWIFPEISTYTLNNMSSAAIPQRPVSTTWWPYLVAIAALVLGALGTCAGCLSLLVVLIPRVAEKMRLRREAGMRPAAATQHQELRELASPVTSPTTSEGPEVQQQVQHVQTAKQEIITPMA